jgi:retron-type reverse transcriptase
VLASLPVPHQQQRADTAHNSVLCRGLGDFPRLANLFMHYAFDSWLEREFPAVEFERFADDAVVHCATERRAREVAAARA